MCNGRSHGHEEASLSAQLNSTHFLCELTAIASVVCRWQLSREHTVKYPLRKTLDVLDIRHCLLSTPSPPMPSTSTALNQDHCSQVQARRANRMLSRHLIHASRQVVVLSSKQHHKEYTQLYTSTPSDYDVARACFVLFCFARIFFVSYYFSKKTLGSRSTRLARVHRSFHVVTSKKNLKHTL